MGARLDIEIPGDKLASEYQKVQREAVKLRTENQRLQAGLDKTTAQLATMAERSRTAGKGLGESLQAIRDPLMRLQVGLANADKAYQSGKLNTEQYRAETQRLRQQFDASASPIEKYTQRLEDARSEVGCLGWRETAALGEVARLVRRTLVPFAMPERRLMFRQTK